MIIKETRYLEMKDQRVFKGLDWNPDWFENQPVDNNPSTPVPFALQRLLKKDSVPDSKRSFWNNTYLFIRLATRASFPLKRIWGTWYLVWYKFFILEYNKKPRVNDMLKFRNKFIKLVEEWIEKKNDDLFWCSVCKSYKPRSHFYKDKNRPNNVSSRCKTCLAAYKRSRRSGKPIELREEDRGIQYQGINKQRREAARVSQDNSNLDIEGAAYELIDKAPDLLLKSLTGVEPKLYTNPIDGDLLYLIEQEYPMILRDFLEKNKHKIVCSESDAVLASNVFLEFNYGKPVGGTTWTL